ncbi:GDP-perosamine synthase [Aquirufa nivalisilvae]|uniref:GDP-perosamine synthase n=1 Tax=Aquirufa nivalisilvae TaxID=2516557 RepID=A0A2S2DYE5_9BACT|nr:UDP-4-amino-4,6-dideoxy-N-acetyl-beta-L-altrosamine transaminase [Aquirufa nivalisilvae]AWL10349.1 GDP-perosamine synthase [Aquirufa nivalisilvae]
MRKIIPYGKQHITETDIDAVIEVLKGDFLTQGPKIEEFEKAFNNYIGSSYSIAVTNGTAALHLCAMALYVQPGDKVIVPPLSFSATANCIRYCGGDVVFSDIDPETLLLDIKLVRNLLSSSPEGTFKGIIPVDFGGRPIQMDEFRELADEFGLWIIEDACHAPGAFYRDRTGKRQNSGNGAFADLAIFSFHPVKHIACGEGGMITTNNRELYERILKLRTHGITRDPSLFKNSILEAGGDASDSNYPGWYMEMQELGYNYRLTDFQAALGKSQLERANEGILRRLEIASKYNEAFINNKNIEIIFNKAQSEFRNAHHLYIIQLKNRLGLYNFLRENDIFAQIHYFPIHLMPYYKNLGYKLGDMPFAEEYYSKCISLPIYPSLTEEEQLYVIDKINSFVND